MSTFTARELIEQAASKVGAAGAGQTLAAEDLKWFEDHYKMLAEQLAEDGVLSIGDDDAIPASWCPYLSTLLANICAPRYGAPFAPEAKFQNEAILRKLVRGPETYEPQTPDYF